MFLLCEVKRRDKSNLYTDENEHLVKVDLRVGSLGLQKFNSNSSKKDLLAYITRPQNG